MLRDIRQYNPNAFIMELQKEEGATEDDLYFGSFGDANQDHMAKLPRLGRMLWEGLINRGGNLFTLTPNTFYTERDPFNLRGKDLGEMFNKLRRDKKGRFLPKDKLTEVYEALDAEFAYRENKDDAMNAGELIPFDERYHHPQISWKYLDIPSTPRDKVKYLGNSSQIFYDEFPEGHPDAQLINSVIYMLNRDIDELSDNYGKWIQDRVVASKSRPYVGEYLKQMAYYACKAQSVMAVDEAIRDALTKIDKAWAIEYKNEISANISYGKNGSDPDAIFLFIVRKEQEWNKLSKEGVAVFPKIKEFGKMLFENYRHDMRAHHWSRYRRIKARFAPPIILGGININKCSLYELQKIFNVDKHTARNIWANRPFESLGAVYNKGYLNAGIIADSPLAKKVAIYLEEQAAIAKQESNLARMDNVNKTLLHAQQNPEVNLHRSEWDKLWSYYRVLRYDILVTVRKKLSERK